MLKITFRSVPQNVYSSGIPNDKIEKKRNKLTEQKKINCLSEINKGKQTHSKHVFYGTKISAKT